MIRFARHSRRTRWLAFTAGLAIAVCMATGRSRADEPVVAPIDDAAVDSVRDALQSEANFPWYDAETDGLARVEVRTPVTPKEAQAWQEKVKVTKQRQGKKWNWSMGDVFARMLQYAAWTALALLFIVGIYFGIQSLMDTEIKLAANAEEEDEQRTDAERMENLPIDVARADGDFLEVARQYYQAGDFAAAIVYLFSYKLMQLDREQWIRLTKGKTNRQYLKEIRKRRDRSSWKDLQSLTRDTMVTFEDSFFRHHSIDRARFETCWDRLDEFHERLADGGAA